MRLIVSAARLALLFVASALLYYGLGMLLLVPGDPGGPYWVKERVIYGLLPIAGGILSLSGSSWIAIHSQPKIDPASIIKRELLHTAAGIVLVFALLIFNDIYLHIPMGNLR